MIERTLKRFRTHLEEEVTLLREREFSVDIRQTMQSMDLDQQRVHTWYCEDLQLNLRIKGWRSIIETNWSYQLNKHITNRHEWIPYLSMEYLTGNDDNVWRTNWTIQNGFTTGWSEENITNQELVQRAKQWLKSRCRRKQRKDRKLLRTEAEAKDIAEDITPATSAETLSLTPNRQTMVEIFVKFPDEQTGILEISNQTTINSLKRTSSPLAVMPTRDFYMRCEGTNLGKHRTLRSYGITDLSVIEIIPRNKNDPTQPHRRPHQVTIETTPAPTLTAALIRDPLQIFIKGWWNTRGKKGWRVLHITAQTTIHIIKLAISERTSVPPNNFSLRYGQQLLDPQKNLSQYNITTESTILAKLNGLVGGAPIRSRLWRVATDQTVLNEYLTIHTTTQGSLQNIWTPKGGDHYGTLATHNRQSTPNEAGL
jgi:hypothetical protein